MSQRICGLKTFTFINAAIGLALNVGLNWLFLYEPRFHVILSPESAVAISTVMTQLVMIVVGGSMFFFVMKRHRGVTFTRPDWRASWRYALEIGRVAPGIGVRHLNDYAGTVLPLLFIGTLGIAVASAAQVATKIFTLFCRVPQACFAGVFNFYSYQLGTGGGGHRQTISRLLRYSAVPVIVAAILVIALNQQLVGLFASPGFDEHLAGILVLIYMLYVPAYFVEQFFGESLTIHNAGKILFWSSTATTYLLTIPLAAFCVHDLQSAPLAVASKALSTIVLAIIFAVAAYKLIPKAKTEGLT